jgi:hypothetical protein
MSDAAGRLTRLRDGLAARAADARAKASATTTPRRAPPRGDDGKGRLARAKAAFEELRARQAARVPSPAPSTSARLEELRAGAKDAAMSALRARRRHTPTRAGGSAGERGTGRLRLVVVVVAVCALLAWMLRGACDEPPPPVVAVAAPVCATCPEAPLCVPPVRVARPTVPRRQKARIAPTPREALDVDQRAPPPWLEAFRRQVMARSTILAACFVGTERPGAAWWTARFDPTSGRAIEGDLAPVQGGPPLSTTQEQCVLRGLQDTPYALGAAAAADPAARRLRLLLEF